MGVASDAWLAEAMAAKGMSTFRRPDLQCESAWRRGWRVKIRQEALQALHARGHPPRRFAWPGGSPWRSVPGAATVDVDLIDRKEARAPEEMERGMAERAGHGPAQVRREGTGVKRDCSDTETARTRCRRPPGRNAVHEENRYRGPGCRPRLADEGPGEERGQRGIRGHQDALANGDTVSVIGFGRFSGRAGRRGRAESADGRDRRHRRVKGSVVQGREGASGEVALASRPAVHVYGFRVLPVVMPHHPPAVWLAVHKRAF